MFFGLIGAEETESCVHAAAAISEQTERTVLIGRLIGVSRLVA